MNKSRSLIILLTLGILGLVSSFLVMGGSIASAFAGLQDGQEVSCTVVVNAPYTGANLVIPETPSCHATDDCFVSLFKAQDITRLKGNVGLWQSGVLYADEAVDLSRLETRKTFTITACVPEEASQVRIGIITETGGVVNDQAITIT